MSEKLTDIVDLSDILQMVKKGIENSYIYAGFCLNAASNDSFTDYELVKHSKIALVPSGASSSDIKIYKSEYIRWSLTTVFRDIIEVFSLFLDEMNQALNAIKYHKSSPQKKYGKKDQDAFPKLSFPNKLENLKLNFNISPYKPESIKTIQRTRNCLTHRQGIVDKSDINYEDELQTHWIFYDIFGEEPNGKIHSLNRVPVVLPEGTKIRIKKSSRIKKFKLGDSVNFTATELAEILYYLHTEAVNICNATKDYAVKIDFKSD